MAQDYHELASKLRAAAGGKLDAQFPDDAVLVRTMQSKFPGRYDDYVVPQGAKDAPRATTPAKPTAGKAGPGIIGRGAQLSRDLITGSSDFGRGVVGGAISGVGRTVGDIENTIAAGLQEYAPSYAHPAWLGKDIQSAGDWVTGQPSMGLSNLVTGEKPQPSMSSQAGQFVGGLIPEIAQYAGATGVARGIVRPATKIGSLLTSGAAQGGLAAAKRAMETPVEGVERRSPEGEFGTQSTVGAASDWAGAIPNRLVRGAVQAGLGYAGGEGDWLSKDRATSAAIQGGLGVVMPHAPITTVPRPVARTGAMVANAAGLPGGNIASMFDPNTRPKLEDFYTAPTSAQPPVVATTPPAQGPMYGPEPQPPIQGPAPRPAPLVTNTGADLMGAFFPQAPAGPTPLRPSPAPGGRPVSTPGYTPPAPLAGEVNQPPPGPPNLGTIPPIYRAPGEPPATSTVTHVGEGVTEMDLPYGPQEQPPLQGPQPQPPLLGPEPQPPIQGPAEGPPYMGPGGGPSSTPPVDLASIAKPQPQYIPPTRPLLPPRPVPPPDPLVGQMQGLYDTQNAPPTHEIPPFQPGRFGVGREGPGTLGDVGRMGIGTTGYGATAAPPLPMGPTTGASLGLRSPWKSAQESQEAIQRAREGTLGRPWRSQADEDDAVQEMFNTGELTPLVTNKPKAKRGGRGTRPKMTTTGPPTPEGLIIQELDDSNAPAAGGKTPPMRPRGARLGDKPAVPESSTPATETITPVEDETPPPPPPPPPELVVGRGGKGGRVKKK